MNLSDDQTDDVLPSASLDMSDVTLICITYNSASVVEECLRPLSLINNIVILDNASADDSVGRAARICPQANLIKNTKNVGFGTGINQIMALVKTKYVLLMNPDAVISIATVGKLIEAAKLEPKTGIVAPFLFSPNRGLELTMMGPWELTHKNVDIIPEGPTCTWFVTAAVWLFSAEAMREIGGFDEKIWVYCEDLDVCIRMARHGYSMLVLPDAQGEHLVSQAAPPTLRIRWRKEWNIIWGHLYLTNKFESAASTKQEAWRLIRKHGPKVPFYLLVLDAKRFMRDLAITSAAVSYLSGRNPSRSN
jgi:N-acetylglucosaminyl-diphospho-decaprenol L-rhamnosyltransferase